MIPSSSSSSSHANRISQFPQYLPTVFLRSKSSNLPNLPYPTPTSPAIAEEQKKKKKEERKNSRNKLPQLPPNHLLRNHNILINLPIVNLELQSHEVRQDRSAALLRLDRRCSWRSGEFAGERETIHNYLLVYISRSIVCVFIGEFN